MHTKMKGEGIKGLFIEQIVPVMERHGYHFMKAKNVFVYEDREWKNECILRFTNWENDQLSLRTEYFVTCKKVSQLYKEAISEKVVAYLWRAGCRVGLQVFGNTFG